jgi:hypothetical protein
MRGLGNVIDLAIGVNNAALATGTSTGKRLHLANYQTVDFVYITGPASAGTDTVVLTLQEHTANTGGTSTNLAAIGDVYYKSTAAALAGTEAWTFFDNTTGGSKQATLSLTNAGFLPAANAGIITFSVEADSLDAGYGWISLSLSGLTSTNTRPGTLLYVPSGLKLQREPALLAQPNA